MITAQPSYDKGFGLLELLQCNWSFRLFGYGGYSEGDSLGLSSKKTEGFIKDRATPRDEVSVREPPIDAIHLERSPN